MRLDLCPQSPYFNLNLGNYSKETWFFSVILLLQDSFICPLFAYFVISAIQTWAAVIHIVTKTLKVFKKFLSSPSACGWVELLRITKSSLSSSVIVGRLSYFLRFLKVPWGSLRFWQGPIFGPCKGQLVSEWLFDVLNFPKKQLKNLMNFCSRI